MGKINKLSITKKLVLYFGTALFLAQICYLIISHYLNWLIVHLYSPVPDQVIANNGTYLTVFNSTQETTLPTLINPKALDWLIRIRSIYPVLLFGLAVLIAAIIFYHRELKKPLDELQHGMKMIAKKDLDFHLNYAKDDELELLCQSFEGMKNELNHTFHQLWEEQERQNHLYTAFAHDLRTPLTVLKGNNDVLRYLATEPDSTQDILDTLQISEEAIERMKRYANTLRELRSMENWDKKQLSISLSDLADSIKKQGNSFAISFQKELEVQYHGNNTCLIDQALLQIVMDKLLENALRFAQQKVRITLQLCSTTLRIDVSDDGSGFTPESLKKAANLFYTSDASRQHSGMGISIANSLLKNYNSYLHLENQKDHGAKVWFTLDHVVDKTGPV